MEVGLEKEHVCSGVRSSRSIVVYIGHKQMVKEDVEFGKVDNWIWREGDSRRYTVKSAYIILMREIQGEDSLIFKQIWKIKSIPSAQITA